MKTLEVLVATCMFVGAAVGGCEAGNQQLPFGQGLVYGFVGSSTGMVIGLAGYYMGKLMFGRR